MKLSIFVLLIISLFLRGDVSAQTPLVDTTPTRGYTVGPGDEITGKVLGEAQYDFVATVNEDGKLDLAFADKPLIVSCKTENELRTEVTTILSKYLRNPQVGLRVTQRKSRPPVSIYGEVHMQQQVDLTRRAHLLQLLSFAGGVTDKSGGMVQVFRTTPPMCVEKNPETDWTTEGSTSTDVPSRMYSLVGAKQGRDEANPEIFPGDIIIVQKAAPVYVTGEVVHPGEINIPEGGLPLMQAVAMSSGITREAKTKVLKVFRRKTGSPEPEVIMVDYDLIRKGTKKDLMLQPFDIVEVGKASKTFSQYMLEFVTGVPNRVPIRSF